LLIDLNRSLGHPKLCPAVAFGVPVPGNEAVSAAEKERRVRRFYLPYRAAVRAVVDAVGKHGGSCLHLSVHSFTPVLGAKRRRCDVGLLYDPRRPVERDLVAYWAAELRATGLHVRRNYPYRGQADGLASALRRELPASRYAGVEIEITQALFTSQAQRERIVAAVVEALARILSEAS
jgi:predicted N-formylglutamate amidohydrolase